MLPVQSIILIMIQIQKKLLLFLFSLYFTWLYT